MSNTRKKLARVFRAPSTDRAGGFAPRELDRAPREFDEDGHPRPPDNNPAQRAAQRNTQRDVQSPELPRTTAPSPSPTHAPKSTDAPDVALRQTSMSAAERAFASWGRAQGRASKDAPTPIAGHSPAARPTHEAPPAPRPIATPDSSTSTHARRDDAAARAGHHDAPRHTVRIAQRPHERDGGMSPRASLEAWRAQRDSSDTNTVVSADTATKAPPDTVASADAETKAPARDRAPRELPLIDRTRARAIRAHTFPRSRHATRTAPTTSENSNAGRPQATPPTAPDATQAAETTPVTPPRRAPAPPRGHDAAETIMWVVAHQDALSPHARRDALDPLDASALRATLQARRLRLLAAAFTELGERHTALSHLRALHALLPHDSWAMLQLATLCAADAATRDEALRWCDTLLRQSPWLAHVHTLRARIARGDARDD